MNSLDFINKEIEFLEDMISMDLSLVEDDFDLQEIYKKQQRLRLLQQIKTELEAWEVCKSDNSILYVLQTLAKGESIDWHRLPEEKQIKLKKALEVNENAISK